MEEFGMIAPVLSLILGLGITRLLLGFVTVFRIRNSAPVDWLPLAWAGILFAEQIQFWWAINGLSRIQSAFTFPDFLVLILLPLLLFLSGALILPSRSEDESRGIREYFERDGRYGLLPFAMYLVIAVAVDVTFFRAPISGVASLNLLLAVATLMVFAARSRRVQAGLTLAVIPLMAIAIGLSI